MGSLRLYVDQHNIIVYYIIVQQSSSRNDSKNLATFYIFLLPLNGQVRLNPSSVSGSDFFLSLFNFELSPHSTVFNILLF